MYGSAVETLRPSLAGLVVLLGLAGVARADHFAIDLKVQAGKSEPVLAHAETLGLGTKPKTRSVLEARAGDTVTVEWTLQSRAAKDTFKDVLIHFFAVKEDMAGQRTVPKLDKGVLVETASTMDFKPKDKTQGKLDFQITQPGAYLLRLETIGAAGNEGHEHFAAIDVVVR
jgi:hypothetical protein